MVAPLTEDAELRLGLELMEVMLRIRKFEERVQALAATGELPGPVHLYTGQEAIAAGICRALRPDDYIASTHRGHGHVLAKGADTRACMAELFGRETGVCRGKGGSMHMADLALGIIGANGIVGAGLPIAVGAGLSAQLRGTDQVAVAFFGDGASNEGTFHEAMNLAAVWALPVVFVCENNGYGQMTESGKVTAGGKLVRRADPYGTHGVTVDGNDCMAVHAAAMDAVRRARAGEGPTFVEAKTYRWREHAEGMEVLFPNARDGAQVAAWKERDPIQRHRTRLQTAGVPEGVMDEMSAEAERDIEAAVEFARASPDPPVPDALVDMWVGDRDASGTAAA